jgi:hypothetical protein
MILFVPLKENQVEMVHSCYFDHFYLFDMILRLSC